MNCYRPLVGLPGPAAARCQCPRVAGCPFNRPACAPAPRLCEAARTAPPAVCDRARPAAPRSAGLDSNTSGHVAQYFTLATRMRSKACPKPRRHSAGRGTPVGRGGGRRRATNAVNTSDQDWDCWEDDDVDNVQQVASSSLESAKVNQVSSPPLRCNVRFQRTQVQCQKSGFVI